AAYEIVTCLEFRRVLFRSVAICHRPDVTRLHRLQIDFHAAILRTPGLGGIGCHRITGAISGRANPPSGHLTIDQITRHTLRTPLRQGLVVLEAASAVGVTADVDHSLVIFADNDGDAIQHIVEVRLYLLTVDGERNVARHDQFEHVAFALHPHASAFELLAQLRLLLILIVTNATTDRRTRRSADQRALATVALAGCRHT